MIKQTIFSLGLLASSCAPAMAQQVQCMATGDMISQLVETYGEVPQLEGVNSNGLLMQVFANEETGTWTAVMHRPDGMSCAVSHGGDFENLPQQPNL